MSARLDTQRGFTLVEVLIVSALFLVVLTATVTTMAGFERLNRDTQRVDDQTERVRRAVDRGMRQLRNLATRPTTGEPTIAKAESTDFVFQTSDPSRTWVRFCAEPLAGGKVRLWSLANATAVKAPAATSCPGDQAAWPKDQRDAVASNITNLTVPSRQIPMFTYGRNCTTASPAACATALGSITRVNMDVLLDDNLSKNPAETRVSSAVFLRNQNERPEAIFTSTGVGTRQVILNGSASTDPEGRTLKFFWYREARPAGWSCQNPGGDTNATYWQGVTLSYTFPTGNPPPGATSANFELMVCDPGDLWDDYKAAVVIP